MRRWIVIIVACGLLFIGFKCLETMKFDTAVSISVPKGPFKGLSYKLIGYQVSMNDLKFKNDFWDSQFGNLLYSELSSTLQTLIQAAHKYVHIDMDVNYLGLIKRHYKIIEIDGKFDLVSV